MSKTNHVSCGEILFSVVNCEENFCVEVHQNEWNNYWDDDIVYDIVLFPNLKKSSLRKLGIKDINDGLRKTYYYLDDAQLKKMTIIVFQFI